MKTEYCVWVDDSDGDLATQCGEVYVNGRPDEKWKCCPYCGKPIDDISIEAEPVVD